MNKSNRRKDLVLGFDDKPPLITIILLSSQFMISPIISLVFPVLLIQAAHPSDLYAASIISFSLIIISLITFIQSFKLRQGGSGMFFPPSNAPAYLAPSLMAVSMGGLPLAFGMTLVAGCVQIVLACLIQKMKRYFPTYLAGLILALIAIELTLVAFAQYPRAYIYTTHSTLSLVNWALLLTPMIVTFAFSIYGTKGMGVYHLILGFLLGYIALIIFDGINPTVLSAIKDAHWFFLPHFSTHWSFGWPLIIPFVIASLACSIKLVGCAIAIQEMQQYPLPPSSMTRVFRANVIDGAGTILAGGFGSMGTNISSSIIALSLSSKINARVLAYPMIIVFIIAAFCPKLGILFAYMPKPVIAGVLLPLGCSLLISSFKMIIKDILDPRSAMITAIAFVIGLSQNVYPDAYAKMPHFIKVFSESSITLAAVFALLANAICIHVDDIQSVLKKA